MRENITKVAERGERLDSLQDKTGTFGVRQNCISMNIIVFFSLNLQITLLPLLKDSVVEQTVSARCVSLRFVYDRN